MDTILLSLLVLSLVLLAITPVKHQGVCGLTYSQYVELDLEYSFSEYAQEELRKVSKKHKLAPLLEVAEELDTMVLYTDLIDRGAYCITSYDLGQPMVILSEDSYLQGVNYKEQLAHELGHIYARHFNMEYTDEQLVWDIVEGLMLRAYGRLTPTWATSRASCLASYGIKEVRTQSKPTVTVIYQKKKSFKDYLLTALHLQ